MVEGGRGRVGRGDMVGERKRRFGGGGLGRVGGWGKGGGAAFQLFRHARKRPSTF